MLQHYLGHRNWRHLSIAANQTLTNHFYTHAVESSAAMTSAKQRRNIRVGACLVTTAAAFFVTLQALAPATDTPSKAAPILQANDRAAVKTEDECPLLQRNARLDRIPDDLKRTILKYVVCDPAVMARRKMP